MAARKTTRRATLRPKPKPKPKRKTKRPARKPGRKKALTKKLLRELCALRADGVPIVHCAGAVGISRRAVYLWLELGQRDIEDGRDNTLPAQFFVAMEKARSEGVTKRIRRINKQATEDWRADSWYLERCEPAFREKSEVEITERGSFGIDEQALQHLTEKEVAILMGKLEAITALDQEVRELVEEARARA